MKRSIALFLALWFGVLAMSGPATAQTPFEVLLCERIRGLDIRLAETAWSSCLSAALGVTGGACFSCIFVSGPFVIFCSLVCAFSGGFSFLFIVGCWEDYNVARAAAESNFQICLDNAATACV